MWKILSFFLANIIHLHNLNQKNFYLSGKKIYNLQSLQDKTHYIPYLNPIKCGLLVELQQKPSCPCHAPAPASPKKTACQNSYPDSNRRTNSLTYLPKTLHWWIVWQQTSDRFFWEVDRRAGNASLITLPRHDTGGLEERAFHLLLSVNHFHAEALFCSWKCLKNVSALFFDTNQLRLDTHMW